MHAQELAATAAAARDAAVASNTQLVAAATAGDWDRVLDTVRAHANLGVLDDAAATALATAWDPFVAWLVGQSSVIGAELELARDLNAVVPPAHVLAHSLATLRGRAIADAKKQLKAAGGPGGRFLHTALIAQVYAATSQLEVTDAKNASDAAHASYVALASAVRATLVLDHLAPGCALLARSVDGKPVHVRGDGAGRARSSPSTRGTRAGDVHGQRRADGDRRCRASRLQSSSSTARFPWQGRPVPVDLDDVVDDIADKLSNT